MKKLFIVAAAVIFGSVLFAQEEEKQTPNFKNYLVPSLNFATVQTDDYDYMFNPVVNLSFFRQKSEGVESKQPDSILFSAGYGQSIFTKGFGEDKINQFHTFGLVFQMINGKKTTMGAFSSKGYFNVHDFKAEYLTGYYGLAFEIAKTEHCSFSLGLMTLFGDNGYKFEDTNLYIMPFPLISITLNYQFFECSIGSTGFNVSIFPKAIVRLDTSFVPVFNGKPRDFTFDAALVASPFRKTKIGDAITVSAGLSHGKSEVFVDKDEKYGMHFYTAYGQIKCFGVTLKGGYNFGGEWLYNKEVTGDMTNGLFASASIAFKL